jgi:PEP-CTERM motif
MKKVLIGMAAMAASSAFAAGFTNGSFEDGTFTGWTQGAGRLVGSNTVTLNPDNYLPTGVSYNATYQASVITDAGTYDALVGGTTLSTVYSGNHAARINDRVNNYSVNVIKQTVANYTESKIVFEWAAVLQGSHGLTDSDAFNLTLTDDTTGTVLVQRSYSSASATTSSLFTHLSNGWYYTPWQVESLDVSALSGHTFSLGLLATDCPYGAHAGYVYLDGFGSTVVDPGPITPSVPEPETYAMMLLGLGAMGIVSRRRQKIS